MRDQAGDERVLVLLAGASDAHRQWLAASADRLTALRHQHLAEIEGVFEVDGAPALLVQRARGTPLHRILQQEQPPLHAALRLFRDVVAAVAAAHEQGVLHLALSPHQVIVEEDALGSRSATVVSFGLASPAAPRAGHADPGFLAPEQIQREPPVDARADVFALAGMLYELACGRRPFTGTDPEAVEAAILAGVHAVVPGDLPPPVQRAIALGLAVDPDERLPSVAALAQVLEGRPPPRPQLAEPSPDTLALFDPPAPAPPTVPTPPPVVPAAPPGEEPPGEEPPGEEPPGEEPPGEEPREEPPGEEPPGEEPPGEEPPAEETPGEEPPGEEPPGEEPPGEEPPGEEPPAEETPGEEPPPPLPTAVAPAEAGHTRLDRVLLAAAALALGATLLCLVGGAAWLRLTSPDQPRAYAALASRWGGVGGGGWILDSAWHRAPPSLGEERWHASFEDDRPVRLERRRWDGALADDDGAPVIIEQRFDEGLATEVVERGRDGRLLRRIAVSCQRAEDGTICLRRFLDPEGAPAVDPELGVPVEEQHLDAAGRVVQRRGLAADATTPAAFRDGSDGHSFTTDLLGARAEEVHLDATGSIADDAEGCARWSFHRVPALDTFAAQLGRQRLLESAAFSADGTPAPCLDGAARVDHSPTLTRIEALALPGPLAHWEIVERSAWLDAEGKPTWNDQGFATRVVFAAPHATPLAGLGGASTAPDLPDDAWKADPLQPDRTVVTAWLDPAGLPVAHRGEAPLRRDRFAGALLLASERFDARGQPEVGADGWSRRLRAYSDGRPVLIVDLGPGGSPVRSQAGAAAVALRRQGGHVVERSWLDPNLLRTELDAGVSGERLQWHDDGRVEQRFVDADDRPASHLQLGYSAASLTLDVRGRVVSASYADAAGRAGRCDGVVREALDYDPWGQLSQRRVTTADGRPKTDRRGVAAVSLEHDREGRLTALRWRGLDDGPTAGPRGCAVELWRYGSGPDATEERCEDGAGQLVDDRSGVARVLRELDGQGRVVRVRWLDGRDQPVPGPDGATEDAPGYDDAGRVALRSLLLPGQDTPIRLRLERDALGHVVEEQVLEDSAPAGATTTRWRRHVRALDAHGHPVGERWLGSDDQPVAGPAGVFSVGRTLDVDGTVLSSRCYDVAGHGLARCPAALTRPGLRQRCRLDPTRLPLAPTDAEALP